MRLTLFGATGRTGRLVLSGALEAGHQVRALARDPRALPNESTLLRVHAGSVLDPAALAGALRDAQAVISVLGPRRNEPVYEVSRATAQIVEEMKRAGIRRLIVTSGAGVRDPQDAPGAFDRVMGALVKRMAAHVYEDMRRTVEVVQASGLDWTIVRVPLLTDGPYTGRVRAGYVGRDIGTRISRADLADFVVKQLGDTRYVCMAPAVSN